jgi:excisionase family DNA binding protein
MKQAHSDDGFYLLTIKQAAQRLCCSVACVYALIANGELPIVRIGLQKGYRVDARDLDAFINDRKFRYSPVAVQIPQTKFKHLRA